MRRDLPCCHWCGDLAKTIVGRHPFHKPACLSCAAELLAGEISGGIMDILKRAARPPAVAVSYSRLDGHDIRARFPGLQEPMKRSSNQLPALANIEAPSELSDPGQVDPVAELLAAPDAARLCSLGRSTWLRLSAAGKVPAPVRLGGSVRWRRRELLAWIAAGAPPRVRWEWSGSN